MKQHGHTETAWTHNDDQTSGEGKKVIMEQAWTKPHAALRQGDKTQKTTRYHSAPAKHT